MQYSRLLSLFHKLNARLNRHFSLGRFYQLSKAKQARLINRLAKLQAQLQRLERGMKLTGSALAIGAALYSSEAHAQFAALGSEFQVNSFTTNAQGNPSIASDADGDFVVVWTSTNQDGNQDGVYAQRYNANGEAQGTEFRVNTITTGYQSDAAVAMDADGDFVVVWQSFADYDSYGDIYAQRYNAAGEAQGGEFLVNTYTTNFQYNPSVAMDDDGDFVVAWQSSYQADYDDIYAQRYNASGVAQGSEFLVNTYTSDYQSSPSVAMDADGDFVIVWASSYQADYDDIYAQRYNASGVAQGSEFLVNTYTTYYQTSPAVAMDADGDFVVTWESYRDYEVREEIYAQRFNAAGEAQGAEFAVNTTTTSDQRTPAIAMADNGNFVISWRAREMGDSPYSDINAQRYTANGDALGSEFLVNTFTESSQLLPAAAMANDGNFVVVWQDNHGHDGSGLGVYGQRFNGGFVTTSVALSEELAALQLYPNPAVDEVSVNLEREVTINILNLSGQVLKETTLTNGRFSVADLQPGVYLVEIIQGESKAMKKLVVK